MKTIEITWEHDPFPDKSWLGKPIQKGGRYHENSIHRAHGWLVGNRIQNYITIKTKKEAKNIFKQLEMCITNHTPFLHEGKEFFVISVEWDENEIPYENYVDFVGYEILAKHPSGGIDRYAGSFEPSLNHFPHNPKSWEHVTDTSRVIEEFGSIEKADYHYALEDWWLYENYGFTWEMRICTVTLFEDGIELGSTCLGGIDVRYDGSSKDYTKQVERELIAELLA